MSWDPAERLDEAKRLGARHGSEPGNVGLDERDLMLALGDEHFDHDPEPYTVAYSDAFDAAKGGDLDDLAFAAADMLAGLAIKDGHTASRAESLAVGEAEFTLERACVPLQVRVFGAPERAPGCRIARGPHGAGPRG